MAHLFSTTLDHSVALITARSMPGDPATYMAELQKAVVGAQADPAVASLVLTLDWSGKSLGSYGDYAQELQDLTLALQQCTKPVIGAFDGAVRDAGLEIALACHYRIGTVHSLLSFTQAKTGLMPSGGATQRLPRLIGAKALPMLVLGTGMTAQEAVEAGLMDELLANLDEAANFARSITAPRLTEQSPAPVISASELEEFHHANMRKLRGLDAPLAILSAVGAVATSHLDEGLALERKAFTQLAQGPQRAALRHTTEVTRKAGVVPELTGIAARPITSTGVIGAGTMGSGIAIALLMAGWPVVLFERDAAALERGVERITKTLQGNLRAGRIDQPRFDAAVAGLQPVLDMGALAQVDLIIEAAYETMEVKKAIFSELDQIARKGAILATNTSYLDVDAISQTTSRPADVVGLHFFSPANIMKLLEVVRGKATAPDVLATALALAKPMGKVAVVSGNAYGFIGNRMLAVRRREAEAMAVEGASPRQIDAVLEKFGFAMGPFRMGDLAGLDLGWSAQTSTGSTIRERLCEAGRRGQKASAGFYDYDAAGKAAPSPVAEGIIAAFARDQGIAQTSFSDEAILDRLLWPMIDEGARLLAEGIARNSDDIDAVWLHGYGWPAHTGGPMYHARQIGIAEVCQRLDAMCRPASPALRAMGT